MDAKSKRPKVFAFKQFICSGGGQSLDLNSSIDWLKENNVPKMRNSLYHDKL